MKVWTYPERTYNELGAVRWAVNWYTLRPGWKPEFDGDSPDPAGDMICNEETFRTEAQAKGAAARRVNDDFFGSPTVQKQVVDWYVEEDRIAEWADVGDPIYL